MIGGGAMSVHENRFIENRKWEDTAKEISQLESQGWELVSITHGGAGTGLKGHQAWVRKPLFQPSDSIGQARQKVVVVHPEKS